MFRHEKLAIKHDPTIVDGFHALSEQRLQDRRRQLRRAAAAALRSRDAGGGRQRGHRRPLADLLSRHHAARPRQGHLRRDDRQAARDFDRRGRDHRRHAERSRDVRQERHLDRDGQRRPTTSRAARRMSPTPTSTTDLPGRSRWCSRSMARVELAPPARPAPQRSLGQPDQLLADGLIDKVDRRAFLDVAAQLAPHPNWSAARNRETRTCSPWRDLPCRGCRTPRPRARPNRSQPGYSVPA